MSNPQHMVAKVSDCAPEKKKREMPHLCFLNLKNINLEKQLASLSVVLAPAASTLFESLLEMQSLGASPDLLRLRWNLHFNKVLR